MLTIEQIRDAIRSSEVNIDALSMPVKKNFSDLGLDSIDVFNIIIELQNITGIEIPEPDINILQSIEKICEYFEKKMPG
jgi:acyl carrier protein